MAFGEPRRIGFADRGPYGQIVEETARVLLDELRAVAEEPTPGMATTSFASWAEDLGPRLPDDVRLARHGRKLFLAFGWQRDGLLVLDAGEARGLAGALLALADEADAAGEGG